MYLNVKKDKENACSKKANSPMVCVWMPTYQHKDFIALAIDGVLMQKANFPIKLIISDDASTDGTREICVTYRANHPDIIELILPSKNTNTKVVLDELYPACFKSGAKYIAMCEGDDYWMDPFKLQKQVDFLENNRSYAGCQHKTMIRSDDGTNSLDRIQCCDHEELDLHDVLARNFFSAGEYSMSRTHTSSLLFKCDIFQSSLPPEFYESAQGDHFLYVLITMHGKIKVLPDVMSVYRLHGRGLSSTIGLGNFPDKEKRRNMFLHMYDLFQKILPQEYYYEIEYIKKGLRLFFKNEDITGRLKEQIEDMAFKHAIWVWEYGIEKQCSEIALWGAGRHTRELLRRLSERELRLPCIIFDRDAHITMLCGIPVKKPQTGDRDLFEEVVLSSMIFQDSMRQDVHRIFGEDTPCLDLYEGVLLSNPSFDSNRIVTK